MERLKYISPPDQTAMALARQRWNGVAKPLGSLGLLEDAVVRIAGITAQENVSLDRRCVVAMCADNGVVCEGVSQSDSSVTAIVAKAMAEGQSNINLLAKVYGAEVFPIDVGMRDTVEALTDRKIARGTRNIAIGPAMELSQAKQAISVGIDTVCQWKQRGYQIIVTGEMGIGNTTTASAIASVLLGLPPSEVTGRGAGLSTEGLRRKIAVIERAIAVNRPQKSQPLALLAKLGGFDIAGMIGLFLGGAIYRVPVVIDGFISAVAAALAGEICPLSREYMLCSHVSKEPAAVRLLEYLGLQPLITAGLCLGEGTGGIMLLPLLDGALAIYHSSHTFDNLSMERYVKLS